MLGVAIQCLTFLKQYVVAEILLVPNVGPQSQTKEILYKLIVKEILTYKNVK